MRLLIAGGCGYIGSHTASACVAAGHEVWVYDNLSTGHREAIPGLNLILGELGDHHLLTAKLREHRIEAVVISASLRSSGLPGVSRWSARTPCAAPPWRCGRAAASELLRSRISSL